MYSISSIGNRCSAAEKLWKFTCACLSPRKRSTVMRQEPGPERVAGSRSASRTRSLVLVRMRCGRCRGRAARLRGQPGEARMQVQPLLRVLSRIPVAQFYPSFHVASPDPNRCGGISPIYPDCGTGVKETQSLRGLQRTGYTL